MNRISGSQMAAMLLIGDVFTLFCLNGSVSVITAAGFLTAAVIQLLLMLPIAFMLRKGSCTEKISEALLLAAIILSGAMIFRMQWDASQVIHIPTGNAHGIYEKLIISGLISAACLYISSTGIKSLARASVIAGAVGAIGIAIVITSAIFRASPENLSRYESGVSYADEVIRALAISSDSGTLIVLLTLTKVHEPQGVFRYFMGKAVITTAMLLTTVLVVGGVMSIADFPLITAAQLSQPFSVQRIDSLFLMNFAVFAVFSTAIRTASAAYLTGKLFPKFSRFRSSIVLLIMITAAFLLPESRFYALSAAVLPIVVLLILALKKSLNRKGGAHEKHC